MFESFAAPMDAEFSSTWVRSLDKETETPIDGTVVGNIPDWLEGTLTRNGSGIFKIGATDMNHLFDGFSVIHRFSIHKGKSTYQNRILKCDAYKESKAANRLTVHQFGTYAFPDPCKSLMGRLMARFEPVTKAERTDNCAVNVCYFGDKLYAMTETPFIRQVDPDTLETIGEKLNISNYIAVNSCTAHPHVDEGGNVFNMGNSVGPNGPAYNIVKFPSNDSSIQDAKIVATFPSRWKMSHSYYHSFGITENYFIFVEYPLVLNAIKLLSMNITQKPYDTSMEWDPSEKTKIFLVDRATGVPIDISYEAPPFFCFHHGNSYEKDGYVIMDLSHCKDASIISGLSLESLRNNKGDFTNTYYTRFILPLIAKPPVDKTFPSNNLIELEGSRCSSYWINSKTIFCEPDRLSDLSLELPRINYLRNGKDYSFVYGVYQQDGYAETEKILKLNVKTKEVKEWSKVGFSPSEPVFVSCPGSTEEDDGVLLFSALNQSDSKQVLLVILNARTFQEEASVEYVASGVVTKDFHGIFTRPGEKKNFL